MGCRQMRVCEELEGLDDAELQRALAVALMLEKRQKKMMVEAVSLVMNGS